MRSSTLIVAAIASLATASPFQRRQYRECTAPQQWFTCSDGWQGCCTTSPCKGPAEGKSSCPDDAAAPISAVDPAVTTTPVAVTPVTPAAPTATSAVPTSGPDTKWQKMCKEDDSNCNWETTYYNFETKLDPSYARNTTIGSSRFQIYKEDDLGINQEVIAVFRDIPDDVTKCNIRLYLPQTTRYFGVHGSGSLQISKLDMGSRSFVELLNGRPANYDTVKDLLAKSTNISGPDVGNGNGLSGLNFFPNTGEFDCSEREVALHFKYVDAASFGNIIADQASEKRKHLSSNTPRSGWALVYGALPLGM